MWQKFEGYETYEPKKCVSNESFVEDSEVIDYLVRAFNRLKYDSEGLDISVYRDSNTVSITQYADDFQAQTTFIKRA